MSVLQTLVTEVNEYYLAAKHFALSVLHKVISYILNLPWLHIHWFVELSGVKLDIELNLKELEKKLGWLDDASKNG